MIQLMAMLSRMASSHLRRRDEAEDVVELAALDVNLLDGDRLFLDGACDVVGDQESVPRQYAQLNVAVGRRHRLNPRDGIEMFEGLLGGLGPLGRHPNCDSSMVGSALHKLLGSTVSDDAALVDDDRTAAHRPNLLE